MNSTVAVRSPKSVQDNKIGRLGVGIVVPFPFQRWHEACIRSLIGVSARPLVVIVDDSDDGTGAGRSRPIPFHLRLLARPEAWRPSSFLNLQEHIDRGDLRISVLSIFREHLDCIVAFRYHDRLASIVPFSKHGLISLHHQLHARTAVSEFVRFCREERTTVACATHCAEADDHTCVVGYMKAYPHSLAKTVDDSLFDVAGWPRLLISELQSTGSFRRSPGSQPVQAAFDASPWKALGLLLYHKLTHLWEVLRRFEHWDVGVVDRPIDDIAFGNDVINAAWLADDSGLPFMADPFGYESDGTLSILFEAMEKDDFGRIRTVSLRGGSVSSVSTAVSIDCHASYPYVVHDEGMRYFIPETAAAGKVAMYKEVGDKNAWQMDTVLVADFPGVDPTVFEFDGRWWLLCTSQADRPNHKLFGFYSDSLHGPWQPHERNPLKIDIRSSRPAGTVFAREGQWFRPAQNSSRTYGGSIVINRILRLTPTEFDEEPVGYVGPERLPRWVTGIHTLAAIGKTTLIDGKITRYSVIGGLTRVFRRSTSRRKSHVE